MTTIGPTPPTSPSATVNEHDFNGNTKLHYAVRDGKNLELVRQLINQGAIVDARNKSGLTPLHNAASFGQVEIAKVLLENGADVNAITYLQENTPLGFALMDNKPEAANFLREHGGLTYDEMLEIKQKVEVHFDQKRTHLRR